MSEYVTAVDNATRAVNTWLLNHSTDGTKADFNHRLVPALGTVWQNSIDTAMVAPASEERAYADGAADYRKLALGVLDRF